MLLETVVKQHNQKKPVSDYAAKKKLVIIGKYGIHRISKIEPERSADGNTMADGEQDCSLATTSLVKRAHPRKSDHKGQLHYRVDRFRRTYEKHANNRQALTTNQ